MREFATQTALLVTAEGSPAAQVEILIDPDAARFQPPGGFQRAADVARVEARSEAIIAVVRLSDHCFIVIPAHHRQDRPENLLPRDPRVVGRFEQRGLDERALIVPGDFHPAPAMQQLCLTLALLDIVGHTLALLFRHQAGQRHPLVELSADLRLAQPVDHAFNKVVVNVGMEKQPRTREAGLAVAVHRRESRIVDHRIDIVDIRKDDVRALAAQFQRHRQQRFGARRRHQATDLGRPGEADLADARMMNQRLTNFRPEARHDVHHARRKDRGDLLG